MEYRIKAWTFDGQIHNACEQIGFTTDAPSHLGSTALNELMRKAAWHFDVALDVSPLSTFADTTPAGGLRLTCSLLDTKLRLCINIRAKDALIERHPEWTGVFVATHVERAPSGVVGDVKDLDDDSPVARYNRRVGEIFAETCGISLDDVKPYWVIKYGDDGKFIFGNPLYHGKQMKPEQLAELIAMHDALVR